MIQGLSNEPKYVKFVLGIGILKGRKISNNIHDSIGFYQVKGIKGVIKM
jgi:hypothetical protein